MSHPQKTSTCSDSENLCVVCCKDVEIYSVGTCDHPVCFECSTRMRVLCNQNECPICRGQMTKVVFTWEVAPFSELFAKFQNSPFQDRKHGLIFCDGDIKKSYQQLLENRCSICTNNPDKRSTFYTFQQLQDHMRREHGLAYCSLCVENLKIFGFERKCYNKQELGQHRMRGDPDNTSHRGHPLCKFCDVRFMDSDDLFRHLRRQHFYCFFCDADGKHHYYSTMDDLVCHFKEEHYLCEEGECSSMPMAAVFRSDIDLKAHVAREHGRFLSKSANKQARTLEVEFTLAPRPGMDRKGRYEGGRHMSGRSDRNGDEGAVGFDIEPGGPGGGDRQQIHPLTAQDFPALGSSGSITVQSRPNTTVNFTSKVNKNFTSEDFPSLSGNSRAPAVTITANSGPARKKAPEVTITRTMRSGGGSAQNLSKTKENFPSLGQSASSTLHLSLNNGQNPAPKVSIHVNHNSGTTTTHITTTSSTSSVPTPSSGGFNVHQKPVDAFPALGGADAPLNPKWVQQKAKKQEPKISKVAPAPQLPPSDLSQFPSLSKSGKSETKKSSSVTVPVSGSWSTSNKQSNNNNINKTGKSGSDAAASKSSDFVDFKSKTNKKSKKKTNNNNNFILADDSSANSENQIQSRNGVIKKRSELKIGSLKLNDDDSGSSAGAPPPGFATKPPPGFSMTKTENFPALSGSNDLTFTNSSGQSYSIKPSSYHQPTNFKTRNENLIRKCMNLLNNDMIKEFKSYSALFRDGTLPPERYYGYCEAVLGNNFNDLFPELLVLLPDVRKQQELYSVCAEGQKRALVVCEKCKQVVFKRELSDHYNYHKLESHFPSLDSASEAANVWKK